MTTYIASRKLSCFATQLLSNKLIVDSNENTSPVNILVCFIRKYTPQCHRFESHWYLDPGKAMAVVPTGLWPSLWSSPEIGLNSEMHIASFVAHPHGSHRIEVAAYTGEVAWALRNSRGGRWSPSTQGHRNEPGGLTLRPPGNSGYQLLAARCWPQTSELFSYPGRLAHRW